MRKITFLIPHPNNDDITFGQIRRMIFWWVHYFWPSVMTQDFCGLTLLGELLTLFGPFLGSILTNFRENWTYFTCSYSSLSCHWTRLCIIRWTAWKIGTNFYVHLFTYPPTRRTDVILGIKMTRLIIIEVFWDIANKDGPV